MLCKAQREFEGAPMGLPRVRPLGRVFEKGAMQRNGLAHPPAPDPLS